jgi:hypothetical protein
MRIVLPLKSLKLTGLNFSSTTVNKGATVFILGILPSKATGVPPIVIMVFSPAKLGALITDEDNNVITAMVENSFMENSC